MVLIVAQYKSFFPLQPGFLQPDRREGQGSTKHSLKEALTKFFVLPWDGAYFANNAGVRPITKLAWECNGQTIVENCLEFQNW